MDGTLIKGTFRDHRVRGAPNFHQIQDFCMFTSGWAIECFFLSDCHTMVIQILSTSIHHSVLTCYILVSQMSWMGCQMYVFYLVLYLPNHPWTCNKMKFKWLYISLQKSIAIQLVHILTKSPDLEIRIKIKGWFSKGHRLLSKVWKQYCAAMWYTIHWYLRAGV